MPSAVNPTQEVTRATTCVNTVLRNTNCYAGAAGGFRGAEGPQREDVPSIVVTYGHDEQQRRNPARPPRRSELPSSDHFGPSIVGSGATEFSQTPLAGAQLRILSCTPGLKLP